LIFKPLRITLLYGALIQAILYHFEKVLSAWVVTLALKRPHAKQASRTAEGSRPYQPQLGHSFRNMVLEAVGQ
jgi:hypothetical protein